PRRNDHAPSAVMGACPAPFPAVYGPPGRPSNRVGLLLDRLGAVVLRTDRGVGQSEIVLADEVLIADYVGAGEGPVPIEEIRCHAVRAAAEAPPAWEIAEAGLS